MDGWSSKLWNRLPYDGQGLVRPSDGALAHLRHGAARRFWRRVPGWSRALLIPMARLLWVWAACQRAARFALRRSVPLPMSLRLVGDCIASGAEPNEALIWRHVFTPAEPHPLPVRSAAALLLHLGSPMEHRLLGDKRATAERLAAHGLATPPLLAEIDCGGVLDAVHPVWSQPGRLFVKPRHGAGARGGRAVDVLFAGHYRINGCSPFGLEQLRTRLASLAERDSLLVQRRLESASVLADLAVTGNAPVLRLTTAREPDGAPFLHSALLAVEVPGESARDFIRGQVRVPIDPIRAEMGFGLWFHDPGTRLARLPWNQAPLVSRAIPDFSVAVTMVLRAMALVPGLALVNWDVILTDTGPVILEGNTCGNWILTRLCATQGMETVPLVPLLLKWAA